MKTPSASLLPFNRLALLRAVALLPLSMGLLTTAAQAHTVVVEWNKAALAEVRLNKFGPPVVARALAIAHSCMYDAWTAYDPRAIGLVVATPRRPAAEFNDANKAKAVSHAAYRCLLNLFPTGASRLQTVMVGLGHDPNDASTNLATPQGIGNAAASAVINNRRFDASNQYGDLAVGAYADYTGYTPVNGVMPFCLPTPTDTCVTNATDATRWQPLTSNTGTVQRFVAPHWERVTPFALTSASQFDSSPEAAAGPRFRQSAQQLQIDMDEVLNAASTLDANRKLIVEYWADGPASELPPGHWGLFAQAVSNRDANNIDKDVKLFFAMHNASFDAGIVAWHLKRKYDGVRPITAIRRLRGGQQTYAWGGPGQPNQMIDAGTWTPYNPGSNLTPAFPGWVSGHATFSAASAAVLRAFTGSDYFGFATTLPANFGRVEPGVPAVPTTLRYATFSAAANEAALSRLYAGIHFSDDNNVGLALGDLAGRQAWAKAQYFFDGGLNVTSTSGASSAAAGTLNWQHTVDALSNRVLVVGVTADQAVNAVQSVSYGGLPLSRLAWQTSGSGRQRAELWYRVGPPVGTATVQVRMSYWDDVVAGATSYVGVHQQTPFGTLRAATGYGAQACVTMANEAAPLVATVQAVTGTAGGIYPGAGQVVRWLGISNPSGNFNDVFGPGEVIGKGATYQSGPVGSVCSSLAANADWAMLGVPLRPAY
jgi:PAP2 superfamily